MIGSKKIIVVLPAFNAGKTLEKTYKEIPFDIVDEVILVDDYSNDNTIKIAKEFSTSLNTILILAMVQIKKLAIIRL